MQNSKVFSLLTRRITASNGKRCFSTQIPTTAKALQYHSHGAPENVLKLENISLPNKLNESDVLVKMIAAPINPADLNMVEGVYGVRPTLPAVGGNEGVGVVVEVGSRVKGVQVNDHVIPAKAGLGTWRSMGVFKDQELLRVPKDIKPEYAATVSVNPSTALRLLEDFEQLKEGDVIVQNGANSMVGTAVIQLANAKKVKTINIIRNRADFAETHDRLKAVGAFMVVSEDYVKTPQFKRLLTDLPAPKLALNCVGGTSATDLARILGPGGSMVTYGGMSKKPITIPTSLFIFKNIQLKGFWLTKWVEEHSAEERQKMLDTLFNHIRKDELKLWMERREFENFGDALARTRQAQRDRKVVLMMN